MGYNAPGGIIIKEKDRRHLKDILNIISRSTIDKVDNIEETISNRTNLIKINTISKYNINDDVITNILKLGLNVVIFFYPSGDISEGYYVINIRSGKIYESNLYTVKDIERLLLNYK